MALMRPAVQTGTGADRGGPAVASRAVDGVDTFPSGVGGACTGARLTPWWAVDLGTAIDVGRVCVVNHGDPALGQ